MTLFGDTREDQKRTIGLMCIFACLIPFIFLAEGLNWIGVPCKGGKW
jgi:hypothetical protein